MRWDVIPRCFFWVRGEESARSRIDEGYSRTLRENRLDSGATFVMRFLFWRNSWLRVQRDAVVLHSLGHACCQLADAIIPCSSFLCYAHLVIPNARLHRTIVVINLPSHPHPREDLLLRGDSSSQHSVFIWGIGICGSAREKP